MQPVKTHSTREIESPASYSDSEASEHETSPSPASATNGPAPSGLILKSGRVRLPDKLMEYLNKEVASEALYWMPEGESFAFDTEKAPEQILNKFFSGTKLSSFLRSISRWGFKRVFYHELDKHVYAFHHPLFKKNAPHLEKDMKMVVSAPSKSKKAKMSKEAKQSPNIVAVPPQSGIASPALPAQQLPHSLLSNVAAQPQAPTAAAPALAHASGLGIGQMSTVTLPGLASLSTAPTPATLNSASILRARLLQLQQAAPTQPALGGIGNLLQPPPADPNQLSRLLALQGSPGRTSPPAAPQENLLLSLAVAQQQLQQQQQQQQRQQQQQQALLDLLAAFQRRNT